jgi:CDP-paratose 2-epimerase
MIIAMCQDFTIWSWYHTRTIAMTKVALITGSAGLIGSESARFFAGKGYHIIGVDNDMRTYYFGEGSSTAWNREQLAKELGTEYEHYAVDIRDREAIEAIVKKHMPDIVIHTAAQPSHDWAAKEPHTDFSVNALGTLVLLESVRQFAPEATFIFTSTNKVYGDRPNELPLVETDSRWEIEPTHSFRNGIDESMSIDQTLHSVFGASKVAADVMVQEYGKYFGLKTGVFRGGCLTGPNHSGAQLHGFLSYLVKCIATGKPYTIFGYKGKQVRDNIHAYDLVNMFWHFHQNPRPGEVYNAGGGRQSNISMLEAIEKIEALTGKKAQVTYDDTPRMGDHIWYISDLAKFKSHYPEWDITYDIDAILQDLTSHVRA